jgi:hypothetical protein
MGTEPSEVEQVAREAWQELVERDDRTSPAEYPEMALITQDELAEFIAEAVALEARERVIAVTMMREAAAHACEEQARTFLSPEYATGQPLSSFNERFACKECADAIRALPLTTEPAAMTEQCTPEGAEDVYSVIKPRVLQYTLNDHWIAPGGEGPLAYQWSDKPHRLVYDLIASRMNADAELARLRTTIEGQALTLQDSSAALAMVTKERDAQTKLVEACRKFVEHRAEDTRNVTFHTGVAAYWFGEMRAALNASAGGGFCP